MSVMSRNRSGTGLGGSCTSLSTQIPVKYWPQISRLVGHMTLPKSLPYSGSLTIPLPPSPPTVRTTPKRFTKPPMSEVKDERYGCSFHRRVTPGSAGSLRPRSKREIATFARSENSDGASGTRTPATANAAWSRIPCTDTRRSSVEVCEVDPSRDNGPRSNWRARSSTP